MDDHSLRVKVDDSDRVRVDDTLGVRLMTVLRSG